jgi:hypothetical protein
MPDMITRTEVADLIDRFASHLNELSSRLRDSDEPTPAGPSGPMVGRWQLVEQREGVEYRWMDGAVDHYETFDIYARPDASRRFAIGRVAAHEISGRGERAYSIPFSMVGSDIDYPHGTFYDTDDHEHTGDLACVIRGAGESRRGMYGPNDPLPPEYERFHLDIHRDRIRRGGGRSYNKFVVIAPGGDHETMLDFARIQARLRFGME